MAEHRVEYTRVTEGTERLQGFSDAIFAFAMTLLGVDVAVTQVTNSFHGSLIQGLIHQWPHYLGFVISFITVGIVWANHHEMYRFIKRSDHYFLIINLIFLMFIAIVPASTALLSLYFRLHTHQAIVTGVYTGTLFLMGLLYNTIWLYALKNNLMDPQCDTEVLDLMTRGYMLGPILFFLAFIFAFSWYPVSLGIVILTNMIYLLPSRKRPIYVRRGGQSQLS